MPGRLHRRLLTLLDWRRIEIPRDDAGVIDRNEERLARMMAFIRVATVPFLILPLFEWSRLPRPELAVLVLVAASVEAGWFLHRVLTSGSLRDDSVLALGDAVLCIAIMIVGSRAGLPHQRNQILTELVPFSLVSSAVLAFVGGLRWWALLMVAALGGTWTASVWPDVTEKLASDVLGFAVWYLAGLAVATLLRAMAAQTAAAVAETREAELQAVEHRRMLDLALHRQSVWHTVHHGVLPIFDGLALDARLSPGARRAARRGSLQARALLQTANHQPVRLDQAMRSMAEHFLDLDLLLTPRLYIYADPPPDVTDVLLEAAHEALANALKYAGRDTEVVLFVEAQQDWVKISVMDGGPGFDPATSPRGGGYTAALGAVAAVGGSCLVTTAPGQGTMVSLDWPAQEPSPDAH